MIAFFFGGGGIEISESLGKCHNTKKMTVTEKIEFANRIRINFKRNILEFADARD